MNARYALIGVGGRGLNMFARPLVQGEAPNTELVALCDRNRHRMDYANSQLGTTLPAYTDAAAMLREVQPDGVIICTMDSTHAGYIIQALEAGCEVITEKPMTTTAENVRAIMDAERRSGRRIKVSFNARYGTETEAIKRLLRDGVIGDVISADFAEFLNTSHGAEYFRRWHRQKANSGGLLIHKATHHFDQLNWWIGSDPVTVYATGKTAFYGPHREKRSERCLTCPYTSECEFYLDLRADEKLRAMYLEAEHEDGYYRDRCIFSEEIDAEDTMAVSVRYANGVLLSYTLNAFAPYEGQRIGFNGTKGRLEVDVVDLYHGPDESGRVTQWDMAVPRVVKVNPLFGRPYTVPIEVRQGGHGGADEGIRRHLFDPSAPDPLAQRADSRAGAMSVLIGVAANMSIATGAAVEVPALLEGRA